MKSLFITALVILSLSLHAQISTSEIQVIQGVYGMEKKKILTQAMQLDASEATRFWDIYDRYEQERETLGTERLRIVSDYIASYQRLDEVSANTIATRCFKNDQEIESLHLKYYKIVKKNVSALKAAQFMQIESYLQNVVRIQLQNQLPFIGEIIPVIDKEPLNVIPSNNP